MRVDIQNSEKKPQNGDELMNQMAFSYLAHWYASVIEQIPTPRRRSGAESEKIFESIEGFHEQFRTYDPRFPYGDIYSVVMQQLEALAEKQSDTMLPADAYFKALISAVYSNDNESLEMAGDFVQASMPGFAETDYHASKNQLIEKMKVSGQQRNALLPADQEKTATRFLATFSDNYKPQHGTNIPNIKRYAYTKDRALPTEHRFGTQGQFHEGKPRVSPLFEAWLKVEAEKRAAGAASPYAHVYFNNLRYAPEVTDFHKVEIKRETQLSQALHDLEKSHDNVAVINLPADGDYLDKKHATDQVPHMAMSAAKDKMLDQVMQAFESGNTEFVNGLLISDRVQETLFAGVEAGRAAKIRELIDQSFTKLGFSNLDQQLSPAQEQAVFFHFIKFEFTNFILEKLQPKTFNVSCKDAIDRGGVGSAYYNLLKSFEAEKPLTKKEFHRALHAAPAMVKGRPMNHHVLLIWNAVNTYIQAQPENKVPKWLKTWCQKNEPLALMAAARSDAGTPTSVTATHRSPQPSWISKALLGSVKSTTAVAPIPKKPSGDAEPEAYMSTRMIATM